MRTIVISDLHIGDPRAVKSFHDITKMLKNENYDVLVLNGDIFDLWVEDNPNKLNKFELTKLLAEISKEKKVIWISGNHDHKYYKVKHLLPNVPYVSCLEIFIDLKKLCILHGHQSYPGENRGIFTRILSKINIWGFKIFHIDLQALMHKTNIYKKLIVNRYRKKLIRDYGSGFDYIISGHTHLLGFYRLNGVELYDVGSTTYTRTYLLIEDNGSIYLKKL